MKAPENLESLRLDYLSSLSDLACLGVERASYLPSEAGMSALRTQQDVEETKKAVERTSKRIAEVANKARAIEQRAKGSLGIPVLFNSDVPNSLRVAVAVMAEKSLKSAWTHECRYVGTLVLISGGADPQELLSVREAFRKGGILRQHCHCDQGRTLDEAGNLTLTETSFRKYLALEPDHECEEIIEARRLVNLIGKR